MNEFYLIVAIGGALVSTGVLIQKVNGHEKRLNVGDKKLDEHTSAVASMSTSIDTLKENTAEIKADIKILLRNGSKR